MDDSLERLSSALAGRYTIESRAGQGGMATVGSERFLRAPPPLMPIPNSRDSGTRPIPRGPGASAAGEGRADACDGGAEELIIENLEIEDLLWD